MILTFYILGFSITDEETSISFSNVPVVWIIWNTLNLFIKPTLHALE